MSHFHFQTLQMLVPQEDPDKESDPTVSPTEFLYTFMEFLSSFDIFPVSNRIEALRSLPLTLTDRFLRNEIKEFLVPLCLRRNTFRIPRELIRKQILRTALTVYTMIIKDTNH